VLGKIIKHTEFLNRRHEHD